MVRSAKWMSSMAMGLLLIWEGLSAQARPFLSSEEPTLLEAAIVDDQVELLPEENVGDEMPADSEDTVEIDSRLIEPANVDDDETPGEMEDSDDVDSDQLDDSAEPETEVIRERYPDGAVRIEREVTQDSQGNFLNHGPWQMWDQRGNLLAQGEYRYGNRTGTWLRWYRSPSESELLTKMPYQQFKLPVISQATFKNDQLDGAWTIWDGRKNKISQWEFIEGRRDGTSVWWFANGKKMREVFYRDGEIDGQLLEWAIDGAPVLKVTYQAGRKLMAKATKYPNGDKKSEGMYLFAKEIEQTPDDWWNAKLQTLSKTGNDEKHGSWTSWHSNHQTQIEGTYEHDLQVGLFTWWHSNGQKALEGRFDMGKQDGSWTWWYANGQKSIRGEYAHGNPTGRWTWWKEDGKVAQSADLSHSEGVVVDTPSMVDPNSHPQAVKPQSRPQPKR